MGLVVELRADNGSWVNGSMGHKFGYFQIIIKSQNNSQNSELYNFILIAGIQLIKFRNLGYSVIVPEQFTVKAHTAFKLFEGSLGGGKK